MKKKLLITGANGFVGTHLVESALDNGFEVFAAIRKTSDLRFLKKEAVTLVYPDYQDLAGLVALLNEHEITHIAHVAGLTKAAGLEAYISANAGISDVLAQAALATRLPIEKFVFVSSLAVMGPARQGTMLEETQDCHPITFYGKSKLLAEEQLKKHPDLPLVILRPTAVYGPREHDMFILIKMVHRGWEFYLGRTPQELSFIYVQDLCQAILAALDRPVIGQTYLLSDGVNYDRYAFAATVKKILKKKTARLHLPVGVVKRFLWAMEKIRPGKMSILNEDKLQELTANWPCSIEKAQHDLGYIPGFPLEKGVASTIEWELESKWL